MPLVDQSDIFPGAGSQTGLGDTVQGLFLSPKAPTAGGIIWGVSPVFLLPTATDDLLGTGKWGIGPRGVVLRQQGPWTVGGLGNHIWSLAGDEDRADVNQTFLQPFVSYTTPDAWTFTLQTESTYNWESEEWSVPVSAVVAKVVTVGGEADERLRGRAVLGGLARRGGRRLGRAVRGNAPVPQVVTGTPPSKAAVRCVRKNGPRRAVSSLSISVMGRRSRRCSGHLHEGRGSDSCSR